MDEVTPLSSLGVIVDGFSDGSDSNPLYALIDGLADDAALELYSVAPYWRLPQTRFETEDIEVNTITSDPSSRKYIRIKLGDDFLRVAEIGSNIFQRPITEVVPEQSSEGKRQHNRFLMAREAKPVGVLSYGLWGSGSSQSPCREIDCYSLPSSSSKTPSDVDATYIAKPGAAESIPAVLVPALEWLIAARAFGSRGDANHTAICQQNAQNLIV